MRQTIAENLDTVENSNLEVERGIRFYALLMLYIRDG